MSVQPRGRRLDGEAAIVTGAGQGISRGIAAVCAREGARVAIADINAETGAATARQLAHDFGADVAFFDADVTNLESTRRLVASVLDWAGGIDILCHNAGIHPPSSIEGMTEAIWDRVLSTNLKSALLLVQACLPTMKERRKGKIAFTSSITGPVTGIANYSHSAASKAGVLGFVRGAVELAGHGITVNAVLPGNVLTPGVEALREDYLAAQVRRIPLGRLADPEDVGHAMLFFASSESDYVTGRYLIVDGGQTLPES